MSRWYCCHRRPSCLLDNLQHIANVRGWLPASWFSGRLCDAHDKVITGEASP